MARERSRATARRPRELLGRLAVAGRRSPVATASPPRDRDCRDFASQAAAQAALTADDRERLDADRDGVACEELFGTERQQVRVRPSGPVQTGGFPRE